MKIASVGKVILLISSLSFFGFFSSDHEWIGKVNFILGAPYDISVSHPWQNEWIDAQLFSKIFNGDKIKTKEESRCEIKLHDQSIIRIGESTTFTLKKDQLNNKFDNELKKGRIWANIRTLNKNSKFHLKTPTAVCSVRGTIYRVDADSTTKVMVYEGAVDVGPLSFANRDSVTQERQPGVQEPYEVPGPTEVPGPFEVSLDEWVRIVAGQQIEIRADGKYFKSEIDKNIDSKDNWVNWNEQRDQLK